MTLFSMSREQDGRKQPRPSRKLISFRPGREKTTRKMENEGNSWQVGHASGNASSVIPTTRRWMGQRFSGKCLNRVKERGLAGLQRRTERWAKRKRVSKMGDSCWSFEQRGQSSGATDLSKRGRPPRHHFWVDLVNVVETGANGAGYRATDWYDGMLQRGESRTDCWFQYCIWLYWVSHLRSHVDKSYDFGGGTKCSRQKLFGTRRIVMCWIQFILKCFGYSKVTLIFLNEARHFWICNINMNFRRFVKIYSPLFCTYRFVRIKVLKIS